MNIDNLAHKLLAASRERCKNDPHHEQVLKESAHALMRLSTLEALVDSLVGPVMEAKIREHEAIHHQ